MKHVFLIALATLSLLAVSACGSPEAPATSTPAAETASVSEGLSAATASVVSDEIARSVFSGRSDHITTGGVSLTGSAGNYKLVFDTDFKLDGAPDPVVGFGTNGLYDPATKLGALKQQTGAQIYDLPTDFNPANAREVYVWCEQFDVPLGIASF